MNLFDLLEQDLPKYEVPEYDEEDLLDAIKSDKPETSLKETFGATFWPKVERWLKIELTDVKTDKEDNNIIGGQLRAKLNYYLEKDTMRYDENVKALVRNLLGSIEKWGDEQVKSVDIPHDKIGE